MANIEQTASKLIFKSGATTLTLDKNVGEAVLQQKLSLWNKKPVRFALSDIDDIGVKTATIHHSVLHRRSGDRGTDDRRG